MYLQMTAEQAALQGELREYFEGLLTPEVRAGYSFGDAGGPVFRQVIRQMGKDGWLGIGWPKEFGGQGRSPIEQFIFYDEAQRARAPIPLVTLNTVGPTLMLYGSDEQKARFLPGIVGGEIHFAIGYTEPGAGTDLASLRTRAVRDGDEYVVNGNKIFTTGAHDCDFFWLAVRTDPDVPKHKGISILLVDSSTPGIKVTTINTLAGGKTHATYFDDVRVPVTSVVAGENQGWKLITTQLNHERLALAPPGRLERLLDAVLEWARQPDGRGERPIDEPWIQLSLARVRAKVAALRLFSFRLAWQLSVDAGGLSPADASAVKVFGTEFFVEGYRSLLEVLGERGAMRGGSADALLQGQIEEAYRQAYVNTFGGGVNEIQRDIIAMTGLGMPRAPR